MLHKDAKLCYDSPKGFVHVFKHGATTCNCGQKHGKQMDDISRNNSRFFLKSRAEPQAIKINMQRTLRGLTVLR